MYGYETYRNSYDSGHICFICLFTERNDCQFHLRLRKRMFRRNLQRYIHITNIFKKRVIKIFKFLIVDHAELRVVA